MAERLFSTEFAKSGSAANTVLRQTLENVATALGIPPTSHADLPAGADAAMLLELRRAYITYSAPVLQVLAEQAGQPIEERELFAVVSKDVGKPEVRQYQLALGALAKEGLIVVTGKNDFGDPLYRITDQGASVAPSRPA